MTFKEYQEKARSTAIYPKKFSVIYPALGLCGEAGEVAEKIKKRIRDYDSDFSVEEFKEIVSKEIFDVVWYCANLASDLGLDFNKMAEQNIAKLADRKKRGVLHGSGDNR